jgi:hypothetical protein
VPDLTTVPTTETMRQWRDQLNGEWSAGTGRAPGLDRQMELEEDIYFQHFPIDAPKGKMPVRTGSAPSDADAAIDSIVPSDITVKVQPAKKNKKYEEQAVMLALFGKGMLRHWRRKKDVLRLLASDMVIRRVGIGRVLVDENIWSEARPREFASDDARDQWEILHRRKNPILLERRNPRHVRWRDDEQGNLLVVVESFRSTVLEAMLTYSYLPEALKLLKPLRPQDYVEIDDIWYREWRCLFINNQPIFPGKGANRGVLPHGYRFIPYVIAPFRELGFESPGERYRGMLTNAAGLYPIESQVLTMQVWLLAWNAWRTWVSWTVDGRAIEIMPGQTIPINRNQGEYIEMLEGRATPPELLQTAAVMDSYIQRNGVAQGPRTQEGTRSAQQVWAIQSIRQLKVEAAKVSLQNAINDALSLAASHLETILQEDLTLPVPGTDEDGNEIGYVQIHWDEIRGYVDAFQTTFGKRLDPALLEQAKALMTLAMNNWMPLKTSYELSGLTDNPQEWVDMLLLQSVDRQPFMMQIHALQDVRETFGEDSVEYKLTLQQIMQAKAAEQQQQGPGVPPAGPVQPTAGPRGPAATGEAGPSQMGGMPSPARPANGATPALRPAGVAGGSPPGQTF